MIISRAPKSFRWFYGVSLACGAMCLILAIGGRTIAAGVFGAAAGVFGRRTMTERFLSLKEVGERLGVKNPAAKGYNLPEPDALIGATRGWLPETIDRWNAARPGRGVGGGRPRKHPEE